jgi:hypothetical protein
MPTARRVIGLLLVACLLSLHPSFSGAADPKPTPEGIEFFEKKIRPLLVDNCYKCHSGDKVKGKLHLDSRASIVQGGDNGPAIVPGEPEKSLLVKAVRYQGELRMPPRSKLAEQHIADLTAWVKMGAPWPETGTAKAPTGKEAFDLNERKKHWAWLPVKAAPPPAPPTPP